MYVMIVIAAWCYLMVRCDYYLHKDKRKSKMDKRKKEPVGIHNVHVTTRRDSRQAKKRGRG